MVDAGALDDAPLDARVFDAAPPPASRPAVAPYSAYVDPFIGTGGVAFRDIGSTHPGPQMPFGMVRPGPDTGDASGNALGFYHCSGYAFGDEYVRAFSHSRSVAFMPTIGFSAATANARGLLSHMDKTREQASVSFYRTVLDDPRFGGGREIEVETTATSRVGVHRITFGRASDASIVFDLAHAHPGVDVREGLIRVLPATREIEGSVLVAGGYSDRFGGVRFHFVARFSEDFASFGTWSPADGMGVGGVLSEGEAMRTANDGGAFVRFDVSLENQVSVAVALSQIDIAHARMNLEAEAADIDFARVETGLKAAWEETLAQVEIEGRSEDDFRIFYTALYHSFLMPTLATDVDGRYRGIDGEVHLAEGFTYYTDFSLWDTYRTMHTLITLLAPETQRDFNRSLVAMGEQRGTFPRWPLGTGESGGMVGDPAVIVLADSLVRGVDDFDVRRAYEIALRSADADVVGARGGMEPYLRLGYVSAESGGASAGRTMEFAYPDHAVGVLAGALGESAAQARFEERARNYQNVYDPAQGFFVARNEDGTFQPANPTMWTDAYSEGNAWQYLWLATRPRRSRDHARWTHHGALSTHHLLPELLARDAPRHRASHLVLAGQRARHSRALPLCHLGRSSGHVPRGGLGPSAQFHARPSGPSRQRRLGHDERLVCLLRAWILPHRRHRQLHCWLAALHARGAPSRRWRARDRRASGQRRLDSSDSSHARWRGAHGRGASSRRPGRWRHAPLRDDACALTEARPPHHT